VSAVARAPVTSGARTATRLAGALAALGVRRDAPVLVHSRFRELSAAGWRAEPFLDALADYLAPGALLMPTNSWRLCTPANPVFSELATPSETGLLTELFRTTLATRRSLHPTNAVSGLGGDLELLLGGHHLDDTPCGRNSPYARLIDTDGQVVMIGCGLYNCSNLHTAEDFAAPELYFEPPERAETYSCEDRRGHRVTVVTRRALRAPRNYERVRPLLRAEGAVREAAFDGAVVTVFDARDMARVAGALLAAEPGALLGAPGTPPEARALPPL
jgi:aminoglycoside 3-N-acetyltransferase